MEPDDLLCLRNARSQKGKGEPPDYPILPARRAPTMKRWSLDARSEGQSDGSPRETGRLLVMDKSLARQTYAGGIPSTAGTGNILL